MISRISAVLFAALLAAAGLQTGAPKPNPAEAARLNNLGCAYMNQQLFEKGLKAFQDAVSLDPKLSIARLNQGIALLNLQKIEEARAALDEAVKSDPKNPNALYNLGLLGKNTGDPQAAIEAFRRVTELAPYDADTWYFLGTVFTQAKRFPQAIEAFQHALQLNPLHASAEFGLARAYQQAGDVERGREHLKKFQYVTEKKLGSPISLAYGEQGQYSRAVESPAYAIKPPAQIKVQFVDVTKEAGIATQGSLNTPNDGPFYLAPGACFLDYHNDGNIDLFLADNGAQGGESLFRNLGNGKFEDATKKAGFDPQVHAVGCTAGDYDNDGFEDLAVSFINSVAIYQNQRNGTFTNASRATGLTQVFWGSVFGLTFIDYDHDGDLDLIVGGSSCETGPGDMVLTIEERKQREKEQAKVRHEPKSEDSPLASCPGEFNVWRNNANNTFSRISVTNHEGSTASLAAIGSDTNNDRAVDIVSAPALRNPVIYQNQRDGEFNFSRRENLFSAESGGSHAVASLDFDHDGWMDYAFTYAGSNALILWRNDHGKSFEPVRLPDTGWVRAFGVAAFDYDNDGWVDLVAVGETKEGKGEVRLFRNLGPDGFKDVTADVGLDKIQLKDPRAIITGDYDNDGAVDLLITQNHGPAVLLRNVGGNKNHWMRLALKGLADNKSAIGTKVEVFAGGNRQKFEIYGSNGYLGQNSPYLTVGLGDAKEADIVRMLWPTGVLQDEIQVAGDKQQDFLEIDRRGSSCPTLFVWNGKRYEFVADMLGAGVVGHWIGPNQRDIPRPIEYIKIDRNAIREKNGQLSFRFMEPLEEAVYLDQVQLLAVDHPTTTDVYPNEYFASNPPYPQFKIVTSRDAHRPATAWDDHGHSVLPDLVAHRYFGDFSLTQFQGFAQPHSLTLDLGEAYTGGPLWLLMHGETEYFSANSMYAASQANVQAIPPFVEALRSDGKWVRVMDDMGFPAGGPRTMTADLTGKIPANTKTIRITTNLQIYWDDILVSRTPQQGTSFSETPRLTPVPLIRADLAYHGFPLKIEGKPAGNVQYIYEQVSATGPYTRPAGNYTRYGEVLPLLTATDDRLVVFGSGDEVSLDFDPSSLPVLPAGWVRDYFFVASGYEKDMDFYAAEGDTVAPLPFLSMGEYPYKTRKSFPLDDAHVNYLLEYNTRHVSGHEERGYWFDYGHKR